MKRLSDRDELPAPTLSVVVVTPDTFATVRRTVRHLREQGPCDGIELIVVAPSADAIDDAAPTEIDGFRRVICEPADGPVVCVERAAVPGLLRASAPVVAIVEDHAFTAPGWARALLDAHEGPWSAVGCGMSNANPDGSLSWGNLMIAYGRWVEPEVASEIGALPGHNVSYKRQALEPYFPRLAEMLGRESTLHQEMIASGGRLYLEPRAGIAHLNPSLVSSSMGLRFRAGRLYGAMRARRAGWSVARRMLYIVSSPLIPLVRFRRFRGELFASPARRRLLRRIWPGLLFGLAMDALGQAFGYAAGPGRSREWLAAFEIDRIRHLSSHDRRQLEASSPSVRATTQAAEPILA